MINAIFTALTTRRERTIAELENFHRSELLDAGVSDAQLRAFLAGR